MNEISVLHYLSQSDSLVPISYSVDRTQAVGDIGWNETEVNDLLDDGGIRHLVIQKSAANL